MQQLIYKEGIQCSFLKLRFVAKIVSWRFWRDTSYIGYLVKYIHIQGNHSEKPRVCNNRFIHCKVSQLKKLRQLVVGTECIMMVGRSRHDETKSS